MQRYDELPAEWPIVIHRGSTWEYTGRIMFGDVLEDTDGWRMEFTIKESPDDSAPVVATFTTENGRCLTGIHTDGVDDVNWWIRLSSMDTRMMTPGVYYHNIWLIPPDGETARVAYFAGSCCIEPEVRS